MARFFQYRDRFGNSPAVYILMAMLFCGPLAWSAIKQTRLENDVENWLPGDDPQLRVLRWTHAEFPVAEQIFLTWNDAALGDPRLPQLVNELAGSTDRDGIKRSGVKQVAKVVEPRSLIERMLRAGIDYPEAIRRLQGTIVGVGPLRIELTSLGATRIKRIEAELARQAKAELGLDILTSPADSLLAHRVLMPPPETLPQADTSTTAPDRGTVATASDTPAADPANEVLNPREIDYSAFEPAVLSISGDLLETRSVEHHLQLVGRQVRIGSPTVERLVEWLSGLTESKLQVGPSNERLVERCFFVAGSPVAVAITLTPAGLDDRGSSIAAIRKAAEKCEIPNAELHLGGSSVAGSELNAAVSRAAWDRSVPWYRLDRKSILLSSLIVGLLMAVLLIQHARLTVMVLVISCYTTFLATALVPATGGSMNMVLIVMPSLLLVVTLSGAIHVANYWKHAAAKTPDEAVMLSCQTAWTPCFLASTTTAIGLASLCTSPLLPVRDFGLYAAAGVMLSFLMVVYGLPALLHLFPSRPPQEHELEHPGWRAFGQWLVRRPVLQSIVQVSVAIGVSAGLYNFGTETKVVRYFPEDSRVIQDYWFLEQRLAGIAPIETVVRFDEQSQSESTFLQRIETVRRIQEAIRKHPEVTGALSLADFLPASTALEPGASRLEYLRHHKRSSAVQDRIRDGGIQGVGTFYSVSQSDQDLDRPGDRRLSAVGDELWRITAQVSVMNDNDYGQITRDFDRIAQEELRSTGGAQHVVTGTVPLFLRTQQAVLESLISSFAMAFGLILLVMIALLRSVVAGLISMIPNVLPVTITFGAISLAGQRVDIGTMITASIALGLAVDGTLHFITWFRELTFRGVNQKDAVVECLRHCGPAIWQTSLAVGLGLLMLMPAELLLISRFGWLMAVIVGVALLGDVMLLPVLLAGPLGHFVMRHPPQPEAAPDVLRLRPHDPADDDQVASDSSAISKEPPLLPKRKAAGGERTSGNPR